MKGRQRRHVAKIGDTARLEAHATSGRRYVGRSEAGEPARRVDQTGYPQSSCPKQRSSAESALSVPARWSFPTWWAKEYSPAPAS